MEPTTITLHTGFQIGQVDPRIFGGFLEHMGRAVYEGVYDPDSAHADKDELMRWIQSGEAAPSTIFVTHGEPNAAQALAERIEGEVGALPFVPQLGDMFDLDRM